MTGGGLKNLSTAAVIRLILFSFLLIVIGMALLLSLPDENESNKNSAGKKTPTSEANKEKSVIKKNGGPGKSTSSNPTDPSN